MVKLFEETKPIDLLTVSSQLKKENKLNQVGGDFYLIQLTKKSFIICSHSLPCKNYSSKIYTTKTYKNFK
jgi:hypothetical protein